MGSSKRPRVLVAMSGGVDSSVAAALLVRQGFEVIGATMQVWDYSQCSTDSSQGTCCSSLDVDDARSVADRLKIPFYVLNCESQFKQKVIDPFIANYSAGRTPLPCVDCNTFLKFDHLVQKMEALECDYLATGHYAQLKVSQPYPAIITSCDSFKDQTYFLFTLEPRILSRLMFPIGHLTKPEVRKIAEDEGLLIARKKDSTGICFVGKQGYQEFFRQNMGSKELNALVGVIRHYPSGEIMGRHSGIQNFTIGQSRGLEMDHHEKLFVVKIDAEQKCVWVGDESHLFSSHARVNGGHFLANIENGEILDVKIRYTMKTAKARVRIPAQANTSTEFELEFLQPQRAITPGQAAVLYRNQQLLGGGWIL